MPLQSLRLVAELRLSGRVNVASGHSGLEREEEPLVALRHQPIAPPASGRNAVA
jgi:hypothetical protein